MISTINDHKVRHTGGFNELIIFRRVFPILGGLVLLLAALFSNVDPNLFVISGAPARVLMGLYGSVLIALAAFHIRWLHLAGAFLAPVIMIGRAMGFVEITLSRGDLALSSAVLNRLLIGLALVGWHLWMTREDPLWNHSAEAD